MSVGDVTVFNPGGKLHGFHDVTDKQVRITRVGHTYWYYGLPKDKKVHIVDLEVVETGEKMENICSQWIGVIVDADDDEGCDF